MNDINILPEEIHLIRQSLGQLALAADTLAAAFYRRLFEFDPRLRSMVPYGLTEQVRKLMQLLSTVVAALDQPHALASALDAMWLQSKDEAPIRSNDTILAALLWTLKRGLGPRFTSEIRAAWMSFYHVTTAAMRNPLPTAQPDRREPERVLAL
jgi:nitric oxide dioxygenase